MKTFWSLIALSLLLVVTSWAQSHFYYPVGTTRGPQLYVTSDPDDLSSSRLGNTPFWIFFDNGLRITDPMNNGKVVSLLDTFQTSTGKTATDSLSRLFYVTANAPADAQRIGMYRSEANALSGSNLQVLIQYTFYAPKVVFTDAAGNEISAATLLQGKVGESIAVQAHLVVPVGPNTGDTLKANWVFDLAALSASPALKFLKATPTSNSDTLALNKLQFIDGVASFRLYAASAVSAGGFSYSGYPQGFQASWRLTGNFPASVSYTNPDFPDIDSAAIYDTDGDGTGDRIVGWFGVGLEKVTSALVTSSDWPNGTNMVTLSGTLAKNDAAQTVTVEGLKLPAQTLFPPTGNFKVDMISVTTGQSGTTSAKLLDRMGPVIQQVTRIPGVNGAPDTLVAVFNKELDTATVVPGNLLTVNGSSLGVSATKPAGERTWILVVPNGSVKSGDSLGLVVGSGLRSDDGNAVGVNKPAVVTVAGRLPELADNGNGFFDSDADGRMDSVTVTFVNPITPSELASIDFRFVWKDTSGLPFEMRPPTSQLVLSADGLTVSWKLDSANLGKVKENLTSIDAADYGYAGLINSYVVNGQSFGDTLIVEMDDRMSPVLIGAFLTPENSDSRKGDRLVLQFTEAVDAKQLTHLDYLDFTVDGVVQRFELDNPRWSADGRTLELSLGENAALASRPNPADSVKLALVAGGIVDRFGNAVTGNASYIMMEGDPRILVETTSIVAVDRDQQGYDDNGVKLASVTEKFYPDGSTLADVGAGSLGVLFDIGQATIPDSTGELDLERISLHWELQVYTNNGAYVAGSSNTIRCDDPAFSDGTTLMGNCFENRKKIYLRWNLLSDDGRKAGVGAYLAKINVKVLGQKNSRTIEKIFTWGVRSGVDGRSYR